MTNLTNQSNQTYTKIKKLPKFDRNEPKLKEPSFVEVDTEEEVMDLVATLFNHQNISPMAKKPPHLATIGMNNTIKVRSVKIHQIHNKNTSNRNQSNHTHSNSTG